MISLDFFYHVCLWVSYTLYVVGFCPQVVTNYRLKSTAGVSESSILIYFIGYMIEIWYALYLCLPFQMVLLIIAGAVVAAVLAVQYFLYRKKTVNLLRLELIYGAVIAGWLGLGVAGLWYPVFVGNIAGWTGTVMFTVYQIPQIFKIYKQKHIQGFNPWFILIGATATVCELLGAYGLNLPPQTKFNATRGAVSTLILVFFYWYYGRARSPQNH